MNTRKCEHKLIQKTATTLINFLTSDDFCPFDWDINQTHFMGARPRLAGVVGELPFREGGLFHMQEAGLLLGNLELNA